MKRLTREELAHGRALILAAFSGPWRYRQFLIECGVCEGYVEDADECTNPECTGSGGGAPCTFVEAPECYPASKEEPDNEHPQVVATIDVPGLSCLAEKNGEAICWMHNNADALMSAHEELLDLGVALSWLFAKGQPLPPMEAVASVIDYAKSLGWERGK